MVTERLEIRIENSLIQQIDEWRIHAIDKPTRSEAVRRLVTMGLKKGDDAGFESARIQVLAASWPDDTSDFFGNAYSYAWSNGVYPYFEDGTLGLHSVYCDNFEISPSMIEELATFLDGRRMSQDAPTFYELEDKYAVRTARSEWDRSKLIRSCRYMFLKNIFNNDLWTKLLEPMNHPTEAGGITREFERELDISPF